MSPKISKELSKHRLEQAKEDLTASKILYDISDYDDEFVVRPEDTLSQIETAKEIIALAENYINAKK